MSSFQTALAWVQALKPVRALLTRARQPKGAKGASERVDPDRALGRAVKAGNRERVRDLLRSRKVKARSALLLLAVKQRDAEMAHELLCHGVKVTDAVLDAADQAARASWSLDAARAAAWARDAGREPRGHPPAPALDARAAGAAEARARRAGAVPRGGAGLGGHCDAAAA